MSRINKTLLKFNEKMTQLKMNKKSEQISPKKLY